MTPDRLLAHFDRISDAPDAILRLRQFIYELAYAGKLVDRTVDIPWPTSTVDKIATEINPGFA